MSDQKSLGAKFNKLLEMMCMPEGSSGYLSLASGVIHVAYTREKLAEFLSKKTWIDETPSIEDAYKRLQERSNEEKVAELQKYTADEHQFVETVLIHERMHFLQVGTFGFIYEIATELYLCILSLLPNSQTYETWEIPDQAPPHIVSEVRTILSRFDAQGEGGVSPRSILESLTFFYQKLIRLGFSQEQIDLIEQVFLSEKPLEPVEQRGDLIQQMIDHFMVGNDYRIAYDVAVPHFGDLTFLRFPLVASTALCTANPQDTFVPLCKLAASFDKITIEEWLNTVKNSPDINWIGRSFEVAKQGIWHPLYTSMCQRVGEQGFKAHCQVDIVQMSMFLSGWFPPVILHDKNEWWLGYDSRDSFDPRFSDQEFEEWRRLLILLDALQYHIRHSM